MLVVRDSVSAMNLQLWHSECYEFVLRDTMRCVSTQRGSECNEFATGVTVSEMSLYAEFQ